jgi:hypothetical protein
MQKKDQWCWAACVRALSSCFLASPPSQEEIVEAVKGSSSVNMPADFEELKTAVEFVFSTVDLFYSNSGCIDYTPQLKSLLDSGAPVIARIAGKHFVLIYDYYESSNGDVILYIFDPYNFDEFSYEEDPHYSQYLAENYYTISYGDFCIGWSGYCTVNTSNIGWGGTL